MTKKWCKSYSNFVARSTSQTKFHEHEEQVLQYKLISPQKQHSPEEEGQKNIAEEEEDNK